MGFVTRSLRLVLFQKACESHHQEEKLAPLYLRSTVGLFVLGTIPMTLFALWSPPLFVWVFGAQWQEAGEFARSLALWMLFGFANLPAIIFARLLRIQGFLLLFDLITLGVRCATLVGGGKLLSASETVALFSCVGAAMNALLIGFVGYWVFKSDGRTGLLTLKDEFTQI